MTQAADGQPSFNVSMRPGLDGAPVVLEKRGVDLRSAQLLQHERDVLARLSHPDIVELAPGGQTTAPPVLTTYLAGSSTLADRPPTGATEILRIGAQLARTLGEIHALGWAHGSVHPSHAIRAAGGGIVLCSLRRSTPIVEVDRPAAQSDTRALVAMMTDWRSEATAAADDDDDVAARLDAVLARVEHSDVSAVELGRLLDAALVAGPRRSLLGRALARRRPPTPSTRSAEHPPTRGSEARRRHARPRRTQPRAPWRGVAARLAFSLAALAVLALIDLPASRDEIASSTDLPPAVWGAAVAIRWLAVIAAAYGGLLNGAALLAVSTGSGRIERAAARLGPSRVRRWVTGVTSIGILGSALASTATSSAAPAHLVASQTPADVTTTSADIEHAPTPASTSTSTSVPTPTATSTSVPRPTPAPAPATSPLVLAPTAPTPVPLVATPVGPSAATWTVARGDHLWGIAEHTVGNRLGRAPGDAEIDRYWRRLIAANRDRLADPDQPDLIFVGQVLLVPSVDPVT